MNLHRGPPAEGVVLVTDGALGGDLPNQAIEVVMRKIDDPRKGVACMRQSPCRVVGQQSETAIEIIRLPA